MTEIHLAIDRLILHGSSEGVDPEVTQDLRRLIADRLEQLAAGDSERERGPLTEAQRIADGVAGEVWRSVEGARPRLHREAP